MKNFRGIFIKRVDRTVEPDPRSKQYPVPVLRVWVNNDIVPSHKMLKDWK